jgi:hypothetical protein
MVAQLQDRTYIGDASFSVAARVAMQLGRESISNSYPLNNPGNTTFPVLPIAHPVNAEAHRQGSSAVLG